MKINEYVSLFVVTDPTTCPAEHVVVGKDKDDAEETYRNRCNEEGIHQSDDMLTVESFADHYLGVLFKVLEQYQDLDCPPILTLDEVLDGANS